jgi:hypothetical protein
MSKCATTEMTIKANNKERKHEKILETSEVIIMKVPFLGRKNIDFTYIVKTR